jgi:hypothetical protein
VKTWVAPPTNQNPLALGRATAIIDTTVHDAAAWWFDGCSKERAEVSLESGDPARIVVSRRTPHDVTIANVRFMSSFLKYARERKHSVWQPLSAPLTLLLHPLRSLRYREVVNRQTLHTTPTNDWVFCSKNVPETPDYGADFRMVRAETQTVVRFRPLEGEDGICEVTMLEKINFGGRIPKVRARAKTPLCAPPSLTPLSPLASLAPVLRECGRCPQPAHSHLPPTKI